MSKYKAILITDFGNSSTKAAVMYDKTGKSEFTIESFELSNAFAQIGSNFEVSSDYDDTTSTIFKADVNKVYNMPDTEIKRLTGIWVNGVIQEYEFPVGPMRPTAKDSKFSSPCLYFSTRLIFLHATRRLMKIVGETDIKKMDVTWDVFTLLPPGQIKAGAPIMEGIFKDIHQVEYKFPNLTLDVKVDKVHVLAEGYCSFIAIAFLNARTFRPKYSGLLNETVLVIDIGAGTTDTVIVRNHKLLQETRHSCSQGGNNVKAKVITRLEEERGIVISDEEIANGMITGEIRVGTKTLDIRDYINDARKEITNVIVNNFTNYLESISILPRSIGYILVCGGGSISSSENGLITMSDAVIQEFNRYSPETKLVVTPKEEVTRIDEKGNPVTVEEEISLRHLNLMGACVAAEKMYLQTNDGK